MKGGTIDLMAEVVTLFKDEDLIAFFQFERPLPSGPVISGLCKVGRPHKRSALHYFSLDFIVDTPTDAIRKSFDTLLEPLSKPAALA